MGPPNINANNIRVNNDFTLSENSYFKTGVSRVHADTLINIPEKLDALMLLVSGLEVGPLVTIVSDLATTVQSIEGNVSQMVLAISNVTDASGVSIIPAEVMAQLSVIQGNLDILDINVTDVLQKLVLLQNGMTSPGDIATFAEINDLVTQLTTGISSLNAAIIPITNTGLFDISGLDPSQIPTIESLENTTNAVLSSINTLVLRVGEIQSSVSVTRDIVTRETLESSLNVFISRITLLLEHLESITEFTNLHSQLESILNNLADLSGVQLDDLSGFVDISGFELNLFKDHFAGMVLFGDDHMDTGGPSGLYSLSSGEYPLPEEGYVKGSYTNGSILGEYLAHELDVGVYSYGAIGATIQNGNTSTSNLSSQMSSLLSDRDISKQFNDFLPQNIVSSDKVYFLLGGKNDIIEGIPNQIGLNNWITQTSDYLVSKASELISQGAKVIIVGDFIPLEGTNFKAPIMDLSGVDPSGVDPSGIQVSDYEDLRPVIQAKINQANLDLSGTALILYWGITQSVMNTLVEENEIIYGYTSVQDYIDTNGIVFTEIQKHFYYNDSEPTTNIHQLISHWIYTYILLPSRDIIKNL